MDKKYLAIELVAFCWVTLFMYDSIKSKDYKNDWDDLILWGIIIVILYLRFLIYKVLMVERKDEKK